MQWFFRSNECAIPLHQVKWHVLCWVAYTLYSGAIVFIQPEVKLADNLMDSFVLVISFYSCIPVIHLLSYRKMMQATGWIFFSLLLFGLLQLGVYFMETNPRLPLDRGTGLVQCWTFFLYRYGWVLVLAAAYFFIRRTIIGLSQQLQSMHDTEQARLASTDLEMKFLKDERMRQLSVIYLMRSQVSPHFLQNSLNFLYAESMRLNAALLAEAILLLGDIIQYSTQETVGKEEKVMLSKEVGYLRNTLTMNRMRSPGMVPVLFGLDGETEGEWIIPLVLVSLLESASRHTDIYQANEPQQVILQVDGPDAWRQFEIKGRARPGLTEKECRLGFENTMRRLEMAYGSNCRLITEISVGTYSMKLEIKERQE